MSLFAKFPRYEFKISHFFNVCYYWIVCGLIMKVWFQKQYESKGSWIIMRFHLKPEVETRWINTTEKNETTTCDMTKKWIYFAIHQTVYIQSVYFWPKVSWISSCFRFQNEMLPHSFDVESLKLISTLLHFWQIIWLFPKYINIVILNLNIPNV